jgi:ubiquinone/menaquinone biosynthesis C-methylase UbiE
VTRIHDALAACVTEGSDVLEVGCGTGAVTRRLLEVGARVTALDQSPEMLEQARLRCADVELQPEWLERSAAEVDALPEAAFDVVVFSLCLSEMSRDERRYVLRAARGRLRPGGLLLAADEVIARGRLQRALHALLRGPQWLLGWLLAGFVSQPIPDLAAEIVEAGYVVQSEARWLAGSLALVHAEAAP